MRIGDPKSCGAASASRQQQAATITNEINTVEFCIFSMLDVYFLKITGGIDILLPSRDEYEMS
jgi:hypothetical protein